ncbi:hypothetical protein AAFF_G00148570 [Aldrovandia affinis]|uniref:Uncharacterized protein n=1 Tax=Aldrovandia affinis TaxID=143900 RepID=A0AAD7RP93_9TELE|nr:hypothetical protein AAFF_G00148570 [Aldrovandia affinis]
MSRCQIQGSDQPWLLYQWPYPALGSHVKWDVASAPYFLRQPAMLACYCPLPLRLCGAVPARWALLGLGACTPMLDSARQPCWGLEPASPHCTCYWTGGRERGGCIGTATSASL